jgi:hypothetical protein
LVGKGIKAMTTSITNFQTENNIVNFDEFFNLLNNLENNKKTPSYIQEYGVYYENGLYYKAIKFKKDVMFYNILNEPVSIKSGEYLRFLIDSAGGLITDITSFNISVFENFEILYQIKNGGESNWITTTYEYEKCRKHEEIGFKYFIYTDNSDNQSEIIRINKTNPYNDISDYYPNWLIAKKDDDDGYTTKSVETAFEIFTNKCCDYIFQDGYIQNKKTFVFEAKIDARFYIKDQYNKICFSCDTQDEINLFIKNYFIIQDTGEEVE